MNEIEKLRDLNNKRKECLEKHNLFFEYSFDPSESKVLRDPELDRMQQAAIEYGTVEEFTLKMLSAAEKYFQKYLTYHDKICDKLFSFDIYTDSRIGVLYRLYIEENGKLISVARRLGHRMGWLNCPNNKLNFNKTCYCFYFNEHGKARFFEEIGEDYKIIEMRVLESDIRGKEVVYEDEYQVAIKRFDW